MALPLILGGLQAAAGIGQGIFSMIQAGKDRREANKINTTRATYVRPSGVDENVNMWKNRASSTRLAGQGIAENKINSTMSDTLMGANNSLSNSGDIAATLIGANRNANDANLNLAKMGADSQQQNMRLLGSARDTQNQYKDQEFNYNVDEPYRDRVQRKNALLASAKGNMNQGINSFAGAIGGGIGTGINAKTAGL